MQNTPAVGTARASRNVAVGTDYTFEIALATHSLKHLARRLRVSPEVVVLVAELAGLGPREARR